MRTTRLQSSRSRRRRRRSLLSVRRLDLIPACVATLVLAVAAVFVGTQSSLGVYAMAGVLITAATVALMVSGPRQGHFGLAAAMGILALAALASPLHFDRAAPHLAVWAAALAAWNAGFVASRQRTTDLVWSLLVWSWVAVIAWWTFARLGNAGPLAAGPAWIPDPESPVAASVLFSLAALIGSARVLHIYKSSEADDLPFSDAADRMLRQGLGGLLLLGFAMTALLSVGSTTGLLVTLAVLFAHAWWDLRATLVRERSRIRRTLVGFGAPIAAIGLAVAAIAFAYLRDESVPAGSPGVSALPSLQRAEIYHQAWLEAPMTGHGVGSIEGVRDRLMTLETYAALTAPGDARNLVLRQLVEIGVVGALAIFSIFLIACLRLGVGMRRMNGARTLPRLAISACLLALLHGITHSSLALPAVIWTLTFLMGLAEGVLTLSADNRREEPE